MTSDKNSVQKGWKEINSKSQYLGLVDIVRSTPGINNQASKKEFAEMGCNENSYRQSKSIAIKNDFLVERDNKLYPVGYEPKIEKYQEIMRMTILDYILVKGIPKQCEIVNSMLKSLKKGFKSIDQNAQFLVTSFLLECVMKTVIHQPDFLDFFAIKVNENPEDSDFRKNFYKALGLVENEFNTLQKLIENNQS